MNIKIKVKEEKPLIHCITNPISINDCANVILSVGGKPIMAEHPKEVAEITAVSKSLAVNLGNITDVRMESMMISGKTALLNHIPSVIDVVGVACSNLRMVYAREFIQQCKPSVIKGNMSEIMAICGLQNNAKGIDAGEEDCAQCKNYEKILRQISKLSEETGAVIAVTGKTDIVCSRKTIYEIRNGCDMLPLITGTGCMVNALIGACLQKEYIAESVILAMAIMGIAGEKTSKVKGTGSFRVGLMDNIYVISEKDIRENLKIHECIS
ncbi:hydroxyethylthiazole kinase [Hathewaya proteolytica]|uniref:hydroxyethylthiazole kinase n=1 Tax=Hathewaya proteolytica TaxID=29365 RepID=UPI00093357E5|nr:hydroxyethylthiazole kinase [Hathewaya proteolytica]